MEPKKIKSVTVSTVSPSICDEVMGPLEKEMATHFSILAWRFLWTGDPGGLQPMGSHRVRHDRNDLAAAAADGTRCHDFSFLNVEF